MAELKFKTKEEIPTDLQAAAKEDGAGGFIVTVVSNDKLKEFRDNNVALLQERDALKASNEAFASLGQDPAKLAAELSELRSVAQQVKDGSLKGNTAVTAEVEARLKAAKEDYERQIRELGQKLTVSETKMTEANTKFKRSILDREVTNAVLAEDSGVNPAALPDILHRASSLYQVTDEGKLVPKNGDAVVYSQDGVSPMPPKEWLSKVLVDAPYLGKTSAGGGANGGDGKAKHGLNPADFDKLSPVDRINLARGVA